MARREIFNCTDDESAQVKLVKFKSHDTVLLHAVDGDNDAYVWLDQDSIDEVIEFLRSSKVKK